jgi:ribosomal protein S18 acetylase RimI-like enzyme
VVNGPSPEKDERIDHMTNIQWILGVEPANLPEDWRATVKELFLQETGEVYADVSIASLPIPAWDGNLLLVDMDLYPDSSSFKGLMWALPFLQDGVRIAAFALQAEYQGFGWGSLAWNHLVGVCHANQKNFIQLEVKASNNGAIKFYRTRGLEVRKHLENYYKSGLGYMMNGPVPSNSHFK